MLRRIRYRPSAAALAILGTPVILLIANTISGDPALAPFNFSSDQTPAWTFAGASFSPTVLIKKWEKFRATRIR
jgi:hypothetical protein